jgi:succinoglycan biosynthesis transport protein ExoP
MAARQPPDYDDFAAEPRSIDLRDYWLIVRRRWVLVLAVTLLGVVAAAGYAFTAGPKYSATSQVVVTPAAQGPFNAPSQSDPQVNMSTEQAVAQAPPVVQQAAVLLHVQQAVLEAAAAKRLTVTVPGSSVSTSNVLQITWQASSPRAAQAGADAFATAYLSYRHRELAGQIAGLEANLNGQIAALEKDSTRLTTELSRTSSGSTYHQSLSVKLTEVTGQVSTADNQLASLSTYSDTGGTVISAALPLTPSGLGHSVVLVLGVLIGLLLGLVFAFMRDSFDDRVRDGTQLERKLGAATLAVLAPAEDAADDGREERDGLQWRRGPTITTVASPDSRAAEAVRALRATLVAVAARRDLRTLLVVGADASVSSGRIAAELGVALAESGRRVLLVGADMRGSSLPHIFDLPNNSGLSDLLVGGGDPEVLTRQPRQAAGVALPGAVVKRLAVLPSGPQMAHALAILDSGAMLGLLQSQRDAYEFVVLDSPPATVAADVYALAAHVDGVIVLAREARTRGRTVEDLRRGLDQVGALLIGGVLIGRGKASRHRHRSAGSMPGPALSVAPAAERRTSAAQQAGRRPVPPATRPMPVIPGDAAPRAPGGLAKRQS